MSSNPGAGRRPRIFYGWYIVGVTIVGGLIAAGTSQLFMGLMLKPMTEDLGWSRTATAGAITLGTLCAGVLSPGAGWLTDRYGPRVLAPLGALIVVAAYLVLSQTALLWQFYLAYILGRGFAASTLGGVVPMTLAANWFRRKRGRAMGLSAMAPALGAAILAITGQFIIESHGWRMVFLAFGLALLVLYVVPAFLIIRRRPEDMGLLPDGQDTSSEDPAVIPFQPETSWPFQKAIRTTTFWLLVGGLWFGIMGNGAVSFHLAAYYSDRGLEPATAATGIALYGFMGAIANAAWGVLVERVSERLLAVVAMLLSALCIVFLLTVETTTQAYVFALAFGFVSRGESSLIMMMVAQYFGRESYGRISGIVSPFQMLALGLGPLLASLSFDQTGSYRAAFLLFISFFALAALLLWFARRPVLTPEKPSALTVS